MWVETIEPNTTKCASFLYGITAESKGEAVPVGTVFFLAMPSPKEPERAWISLVTVRHAVMEPNGRISSPLWVRVNTKGGGAEMFRLDDTLTARPDLLFLPGDAAVDLAVMPFSIFERFDASTLDGKTLVLPRGRYARPEIAEGLDVFYPSLFVPDPGEHQNLPIVRYGRIARVAEHPIFWKDAFIEAHLIEAQAFGGSSGAPVFVTVERGAASTKSRLLGVLKGNFTAQQPVRFRGEPQSLAEIHATGNVGIAAVVPAHLLFDFLTVSVIPALEANRAR